MPDFCKSATTAEIAAHVRYVDAEEVEGGFAESAKVEADIRANQKSLHFNP